MTEAQLAEIEAREKLATAGPWIANQWRGIETADETWLLDGNMATKSDAEFIAHARDDVPHLVAEVRRLRAILKGAVELGVIATEADDYGGHCLWCKHERGEGPLHSNRCPVFTPEGEFK